MARTTPRCGSFTDYAAASGAKPPDMKPARTRAIKGFAGTVASILLASSAIAQDLPTTQLEDHAQVVRQDALTRALLRQRQSRARSSGTLSPEARAACANKKRAAANLGWGHPKVRRLYALCAQAVY